MLEKINDINKHFEYLGNRKEQLLSELSKVDKEISAWMHYLEFKSFNACQGYIAAKSLSECGKRRRVIKDELYVLKEISNSTNNNSINIDKITSVIKSMDDREYTPKENKMLFAT